MFTGIIEEKGTISKIMKNASQAVLTIKAQKIMEDIHKGDSIAVNGICLTVTAFSKNEFQADVMHETLNRTALKMLKPGSSVNLERAMAAGGRFGGHMVSGHIDGTGKIAEIKEDSLAIWYTIEAPPQILRYIVEKGSIAIDGISLTVAKVTQTTFSVSTIPHTRSATTLGERRPGDLVNLETDIIGKYVERLMRPEEPETQQNTGTGMKHKTESSGGGVTKEFLARYGF